MAGRATTALCKAGARGEGAEEGRRRVLVVGGAGACGLVAAPDLIRRMRRRPRPCGGAGEAWDRGPAGSADRCATGGGVRARRSDPLCSAGCGRWLVLICCERKLLLAGWWLVAGAGLV